MTPDDFRKRVVMVDDIDGESDPATQSNVRRLIEARMSDPRLGPVVVSYGPGPTWPDPPTPPTDEDVERLGTLLDVVTELRDAGALPVWSPSDVAGVEGATWDAEPDVVHPGDAGCDAMASAMLRVERSRLLGALAARIDYLGSAVCTVPPLWVSDWNHSPTKLDRGDSLVPATPLDELWRKR